MQVKNCVGVTIRVRRYNRIHVADSQIAIFAFPAVGGIVTFFFSTFLPLWTVWHMYEWEGVGEHRSLWFAIWEIARGPTDDADSVYLTGDSIDLLMAAITFGIGAILGGLFYVAWRFAPSTHS
jgi:hypothetical protein